MKSGPLTRIAAMTLFAALSIPVALAAQQEPGSKLASSSTDRDAIRSQPAATGLASLPLEAQASISAQLAKLTASDGAALDYLGYSAAISGDTVVVGAPLATIGSNILQGAAYVR